jgi:glycosyltransferase involved in cell wall biosynthesis
MNILIFNTYNPYLASGIVALDLFNSLQKKGHKVKLLVNRYNPTYPDGVVSVESYLMSLKRTTLYKFQWRYEKLITDLKIRTKETTNPDYRIFQLNEQKLLYKTDLLIKKAGIIPDAIIILFAKKFINAKNIYELYNKTKAPVYWLMYDMAPLTGGCHYSWDCTGYQNNCGKCPGLFSTNSYDITYENILFKRKYISKTKIEIIAASEWQFQQAKRSSLFKNNTIHKVLLSVDSTIFRPEYKAGIRLKLNIPLNKKILFFGSVGLTEKRKGMCYLIESLKVLKQKAELSSTMAADEIVLLIAGGEFEQIIDYLPFRYHYLGMVSNTYGIASAYQAANIFICPSVEDSGPMMINQSLMCGTPVVSFEMGVAFDLVITGETGYRAKLKDVDDMAQGIMNILTLDKIDYKKMSDNCRKLAHKLCSPDIQTEKIEQIFKNEAYEQ